MKNLSLILNIVLLVAVAFLFVEVLGDKDKSNEQENKVSATTGQALNVAYVEMDSLLKNYNLYNDLSKQFGNNQQRMEAELGQKSQKLQQEAADLQQKMQNRLITQRQANAKQKELVQRQQNLVQLRNQSSQKLAMDNQIMNKQVYDSIYSFLNDLNAKHHYKIIFSSAQSNPILLADSTLNITREVLKGINTRYLGK